MLRQQSEIFPLHSESQGMLCRDQGVLLITMAGRNYRARRYQRELLLPVLLSHHRNRGSTAGHGNPVAAPPESCLCLGSKQQTEIRHLSRTFRRNFDRRSLGLGAFSSTLAVDSVASKVDHGYNVIVNNEYGSQILID